MNSILHDCSFLSSSDDVVDCWIVQVDEDLTLAGNTESIFELPERSRRGRIIKPNHWYDRNIWECT